jgi:hypothetical protein
MLTNKGDIEWLLAKLPRPAEIKKIFILFDPVKHGWHTDDFHRVCDGHSNPTILVMKSKALKIFGGFTNDKWSSANE